MKRSRAPRTLLILFLATGLLGLTLYVAYRLATRRSGALTTDGDAVNGLPIGSRTRPEPQATW